MVDADPDRHYRAIREMLVNKTHRYSRYKVMYKDEGTKTREIWKLPYYPDRVIHHCLMNIIEPIWVSEMIRDTYAAIRGRGIHDGVRRIRRAIANDRDGTRYCLKMDVQKFYHSISPDVQKAAFRRKVKDQDVLWALDQIADSAPGVPIGNYPSQPLGNLVLSPIDHWVKEVAKAKYYYRYCDDMVVLAGTKEDLHRLRRDIDDRLATLGLAMKQNWQVFPVDVRGVDFLGYRFFRGYTLVRKSIVTKFKRRYKNRCDASMTAYNGWFCWADTHNLRQTYKWRHNNGRIQFIPARNVGRDSGRVPASP